MYKNIEIEYGFQMVLSTIPNQIGVDFEKDIEEKFFEDFKIKTQGKLEYLYKPLKFYMLGSYDVCYLTLIDNFKFSHRLFEPKSKEDDTVYNDHSFQSFSGFALNDKRDLESLFNNKNQESFISIVNLKLNNGLLLGNGLKYLETVVEFLKLKLNGFKFLIFQTFSWFELSLVFLFDKTEDLSKLISLIRTSEFKDLFEINASLDESLYEELFKDKRDKILNTSLFADTNTLLGVNPDIINDENSYSYKKFIKNFNDKKINFEVVTEWHVKPGHVFNLEKNLNSIGFNNSLSDNSNKLIVLGKSDYLIKNTNTDLLSTVKLIRHLLKSEHSYLIYSDIRKIKTYVHLKSNNITLNSVVKEDSLLWSDKLNKLCVPSSDFHLYNSKLKSLKISRQVRNKVLKIFSNYNNGIQNAILFPYFLDFTVFISNLKKLIDSVYNQSLTENIEVRLIEKQLNENIKVFQEGYNVRFMNGYHFENISDFDLDFNSSIQQLLSSYGTLVYEYGDYFYEKDDSLPYNRYSPIIQLNDIDTVSNDISINYSVHHLTSPEFVFSTILKEILNNPSIYGDKLNESLVKNYYKRIDKIKLKINQSYLDDMFDSGLIDINYFIIDSIRFAITFNYNFNFFSHWFWTYNFQNSALYNTSGMINEHRLKMELFRLLMVKNFFGVKMKIKCPTPEIYSYWKLHYKKLNKISKIFLKKINKNSTFSGYVKDITNRYFENYSAFFNDIFDGSTSEFNDSMRVVQLEIQEIKKEVTNNKLISEYLHFKLLVQKNIKKGKKESSLLYCDEMFSTLLKKHYEINNKKIISLKRDWSSGVVLSEFKKTYRDVMYSVDQTGGVYIEDTDKTINYFKINAKCLLDIIDFALKKKKDFVSIQIAKDEV